MDVVVEEVVAIERSVEDNSAWEPPPPSPPTPPASDDDSEDNLGVIIGATVGGLIAVLLVVAGYYYWAQRSIVSVRAKVRYEEGDPRMHPLMQIYPIAPFILEHASCHLSYPFE